MVGIPPLSLDLYTECQLWENEENAEGAEFLGLRLPTFQLSLGDYFLLQEGQTFTPMSRRTHRCLMDESL